MTPIEPRGETPHEYDVRPAPSPPPDFGDDIAFPSDNAQVVGASSIKLRWRGNARAYRVDVFAGANRVLSEPVSQPSLQLPLEPGVRYRWRVSQLVDKDFRPLVAERSIQSVVSRVFDFDGVEGAAGHSGVNAGNLDSAGHGESGQAGGDGQDVRVTVEPAGDLIRITLTASGTSQRLLVPPDSPPITVSTVGGRGGDGGQGGQSGVGQFVRLPNGAVQPLPTAPGPGGNGGDGGHGGTVTVLARGGIDARRLIKARVDGGAGGKGGAPGEGTVGNVSAVGARAGVDGKAGEAGQIKFEEATR